MKKDPDWLENQRKKKDIYWQNNPQGGNYIDGRTPLRNLIYGSIKYRKWRNKVFKRDNYTCQDCNQRGGRLHLHHKKEFFKILDKFLGYYSNLDSIKDKEKLFKLAMKYKPFWDLDNGITLCEDCHKKTDSYLIKPTKKQRQLIKDNEN